jgi:ABC-type phosphate transport system substrate-binding protein
MRTSIAGAALLLVGAGAATVAAVDTTGNNIALNGSDTLFDVTQAVISSCATAFGDFTANGVTYAGGGSGTGAGQMIANAQQIAPMSRALKNSEYCSAAAPAGPALTEALLVGIDGVAVLANQTNSCSTTTPNNVGISGAFDVTSDGTAAGTVVGTYTFTDSLDPLKVLYFGFTHDGVYDCASPTRKTLIRQWKNFFTTDCPAGNGTCAGGITHAWRRSDLSGTTDAFVSVLGGAAGLPAKAGKSVGIGTLSNVPVGASQKMDPFCNSSDANANPPTVSFGGSSDFQDLDPVRTPCVAGKDGVCQAKKVPAANFQGDLGVVLPVFLPDVSFISASDDYPTTNCTTACTLVAPIRGSLLPAGYKCPNSGNSPVLGGCWMPYAGTAAAPDPRCVSAATNKCFDKGALRDDGRSYNMPVVVLSSQIPAARRSTFTYQYGLDNLNRIMDQSFFKIHWTAAGQNNVPDATVGATGICRENDDTSQIGCLADSDPCSVGFAGREAARFFPGTGSPATPQPAHNKALAVDNTTPFTASAADPSDHDAALKNLLQPAGTLPLYGIARRLYVATDYGFGNLKGGEKEFSQCYANNTIVNAALANRFVPVPGGVQCLDYPEQGTSTSSPAPNKQGTGNVALPGCNLGLAGHNACTDPATAPAICGDGVIATSFGEECDPPAGTGSGSCNASCKLVP